MLLRRITEHVRNQNWLAIAIDFVIVVTGVFIGVQIGNWNETRQQRQLYKEAFDRVIVEIETNLEMMEQERAKLRTRLPPVQMALEDLRACRTDDEAYARVVAAFSPMGAAPGFHLETKALDQLINSDVFLPFQSADTRKRLMSLSTRQTMLTQNSVSLSTAQRQAAVTEDISRSVQPGPLTMEGPDQIIEAIRQGGIASPEMVRRATLVAPLEIACKDQSLLRQFYGWEDVAYYHIIFGGLTADAIREDLDKLERPDARRT